MEFKDRGWSGKNVSAFQGITKTKEGQATYKVHGKFIEYINIVDLNDPSAPEEELWKMRPKPPKSDWQYQFSYFTLQLNLLTD